MPAKTDRISNQVLNEFQSSVDTYLDTLQDPPTKQEVETVWNELQRLIKEFPPEEFGPDAEYLEYLKKSAKSLFRFPRGRSSAPAFYQMLAGILKSISYNSTMIMPREEADDLPLLCYLVMASRLCVILL